MSETKKETRKRPSLLERIKESILKSSEQPPEELSQDQPETDTEETAASEIPQIPLPRGLMSIPNNSLLYSLWNEWNQIAGDAAEELSQQLEELEFALDNTDTHRIPLDTQQLELEKQILSAKLTDRAEKHFRNTRPDPQGVIPAVDAEVFIHISKNQMAAWAFVFPPSPLGNGLEELHLRAAVIEHDITYGIDQEALDGLVENQDYFKLVPIAFGTPMERGQDGTVIEHFPRHMQKVFGIDEFGNIDYRVQNYVQLVKPEDLICETTPPTYGKAGRDILGNEIPAIDGVPAKLTAGQNTKLNDAGTQLTAAIEGHLLYERDRFLVKPVFFVKGDVDLNVGNINFLGDVHITGNVRDDFEIHATGTVTVEGLVEGAYIEADKDILISNGILGDGKAVLKAGGSVQAEYIENSTIYAGENVRSSTIMNSNIFSDNEVIVRSGRGTIIGGKLVAAKTIDAKVIGCRAERPTLLIIGEMPYVQEQKEELAKNLVSANQKLEELNRSLKFLEATAEINPEKKAALNNCRLQKSVLDMQKSHMEKQLIDLKEKEIDPYDSRVTADLIHPMTQINIREFTHSIHVASTACTIRMGADSILVM